MSFLLGKLRERFDARLRPSSLRYATWASLMVDGEVYAKSPLFNKNDNEIWRFDELMQVERLVRELAWTHSIDEQLPDGAKEDVMRTTGLLLQACTIKEQLSILERTDGTIVLAYGVRVRAKHTARVIALRERFDALVQDQGPPFMEMLAVLSE